MDEIIKSVLAMVLAATLLLASVFAFAVEQDKVLHTTGSAAIAYVASDYYDDPYSPFMLAFSIGLLKEHAIDTRADPNDLSADAIGAMFGTIAGNQQRILPSWNNTDKYLFESYVVMSAIDVMQTKNGLATGRYIEANDMVYGKRPSATKLVAVHTASAWAIYELADYYPEERTIGLLAANLIQFAVVRHNYFAVEF